MQTRLSVLRLVANILNKQKMTADKGSVTECEFGEGLTAPHPVAYHVTK
jgi:hypothetical protein